MSRGTHQNVAVWEFEDFVHVNKFSILAPDDESPRKCCASNHRSMFSVPSPGMNELMNTDVVMNELMNALPMRQKFPVTGDPVRRS